MDAFVCAFADRDELFVADALGKSMASEGKVGICVQNFYDSMVRCVEQVPINQISLPLFATKNCNRLVVEYSYCRYFSLQYT